MGVTTCTCHGLGTCEYCQRIDRYVYDSATGGEPRSEPANVRLAEPELWLRRRPEVADCGSEFVRDFAAWARMVLKQEGYSWQELAYFAERADALSPGPESL